MVAGSWQWWCSKRSDGVPSDVLALQSGEGAQLQPISRFQAAAVGNIIFIHTHRSLQDILALDVTDPDKPCLQLLPVTGKNGVTPAARSDKLSLTHSLRQLHDIICAS